MIITGVVSCKNYSKNNSESHNITDYKEGVTKKIGHTENFNENANYSVEAVKLNEQATILASEYNTTSYHKALKLVDKAIHIDSTYFMAYSNKAQILIMLGKYQEAIEVLNHIVLNLKPDYCEAYVSLGMLHDKIEDKAMAIEFYNLAIRKYSERIQKNQNIWDMASRAHIYYILDKEKGIKAIDSLINAYPGNEELKRTKDHLFIDYNYEEEINSM